MGFTKKKFIDEAYGEVGLASYEYDIQPEEYQSAATKLDAMMAEWSDVHGIKVGWPIDLSGGAVDLNVNTNAPSWMINAIISNLALKVGSAIGKTPSQETKKNAKLGFNNCINKSTVIPSIVTEFDKANYCP